MTGVGLIPMESPLGPLAPAHLSEFVVGLVLAALVAFAVQRFVVPRFEKMYTERAAEIEGGINRAQIVQAEAAQVKKQYQDQLAASREEASKLRDQARDQAAKIIAEAREQAKVQADQLLAHARQQIEVEREQAYSELRTEVGGLASSLAERIVGEQLTDQQLTQRTVDRFLAELAAEQLQGSQQ